MNTHKNARLTFARRLEMVQDFTQRGESVTAAAMAPNVSVTTVRKWRDAIWRKAKWRCAIARLARGLVRVRLLRPWHWRLSKCADTVLPKRASPPRSVYRWSTAKPSANYPRPFSLPIEDHVPLHAGSRYATLFRSIRREASCRPNSELVTSQWLGRRSPRSRASAESRFRTASATRWRGKSE